MLKEMAGYFKKSFEDILNFGEHRLNFAGIGKIDDDLGKFSNYTNRANNSGSGVEINNSSLVLNVEEFETNISKLPANIRVATIIEKANEIAKMRGLVKDNKLSKINKRIVYKDKNTGDFYSLDTQHGRFEHLNKGGKHLGEVNFNFEPTKNADNSGKHDIKIK